MLIGVTFDTDPHKKNTKRLVFVSVYSLGIGKLLKITYGQKKSKFKKLNMHFNLLS